MMESFCSITGKPCRCYTGSGCTEAVTRINNRRQASYEESRRLALQAIEQVIYNLGQMVSDVAEGYGGQQRLGNQPELRELQRAADKVRKELGGKGVRYTL